MPGLEAVTMHLSKFEAQESPKSTFCAWILAKFCPHVRGNHGTGTKNEPFGTVSPAWVLSASVRPLFGRMPHTQLM